MKKLHKKIIGICGLALVAVMTFIAAQLPAPGASAQSVTDHITVRVVGDNAAVQLTQPANGTVVNKPTTAVAASYENVSSVELSVVYTAPNGTTKTSMVWSANPDGVAGNYSSTINLKDYSTGNGYGTYAFTLSGYDYNGAPASTVTNLLTYTPTQAGGEIDDDGSIIIEVDLDDNDKITKVIIDIYLDGEWLGRVEIPVEDGKLVDGRYYSIKPISPYDFYVDVIDGKIILPGKFVHDFGPGDYKFDIHTEIDNDGDGTGDETHDTTVDVHVDKDDIPEPPVDTEDSDITGVKILDDGSMEITFDLSKEDNADEIAKIKVDIYKDGKIVDSVWIDVEKDENGVPVLKDGTYTTTGGKTVYVKDHKLIIPADVVKEWGTGNYTFVVTTYDKDGHILNTSVTNINISNLPSVPDTAAPDTGSLFQNLNISTEDFVITGLLVFFTVACAGIVMMKKRGSAKASFKRR